MSGKSQMSEQSRENEEEARKAITPVTQLWVSHEDERYSQPS